MEKGKMEEIERLRDALELARHTIDHLRTGEGTKPCPKECGDCLGVETGCYIYRAIGVINRALDGSRETLGRPPTEAEAECGEGQWWCWTCGNENCELARLDTIMVCDHFVRRSKEDMESDPHFGGHGNYRE